MNKINGYIALSLKAFLLFSAIFIVMAVVILFCRNAFAGNEDWLEQCEPYRRQVEEILVDHGVSEDFYFLMVAESRCRDKATSSKGARGFWQLMPATARHYGCNNPDDLECATKAAAKYLAHLGKSFKHFNDIVAAYNMGGRNFKRNGHTNQSRGLVMRVNDLMRLDREQRSE